MKVCVLYNFCIANLLPDCKIAVTNSEYYVETRHGKYGMAYARIKCKGRGNGNAKPNSQSADTSLKPG